MTPNEKAEKIYSELDFGCGCCTNTTSDDQIKIIAAALTRELKQIRADIIRELDAKYNAEAEKRVNAAWDDAIESAAKVAYEWTTPEWTDTSPHMIADSIRALAKRPT